MSTYSIGEVAARSGFTASALRYYEGIGLVAPATRTEAGYRVYDDQAMGRLAFIARAKQLGCSLDEIADLVSIWSGDRCDPVQRRFHDLVTEKIADAEAQTAELGELVAQLRSAAAQLAGPAVDGPCDARCACISEPGREERASIAPGIRRGGPPVACTLDAGAMPERLAAWQAILAHVRARRVTPDGARRLELDEEVDVAALAALAAAEQRCCAFFSFVITIGEDGVALEVRAPDVAEPLVASLFGDAA